MIGNLLGIPGETGFRHIFVARFRDLLVHFGFRFLAGNRRSPFFARGIRRERVIKVRAGLARFQFVDGATQGLKPPGYFFRSKIGSHVPPDRTKAAARSL